MLLCSLKLQPKENILGRKSYRAGTTKTRILFTKVARRSNAQSLPALYREGESVHATPTFLPPLRHRL
jgi:hypothetical protein